MPMLSRNSHKIRRRVRPRPVSAVFQRGNDLDVRRSCRSRPPTIASRGETTSGSVLRGDERGSCMSWGRPQSSPGNIFDEGDKPSKSKSSADVALLVGNHDGNHGIGSGAPDQEYGLRPPFLATSPVVVQQGADDGLLQGGRLWQESQFARVMELRRSAVNGATQATVDACQPVGIQNGDWGDLQGVVLITSLESCRTGTFMEVDVLRGHGTGKRSL